MSLTISDQSVIAAWASMLELKNREARITYLLEDGETIIRGTVRHGWYTATGDNAPDSTPLSDVYVRVTTTTGGERYEKFARLADLTYVGGFATR